MSKTVRPLTPPQDPPPASVSPQPPRTSLYFQRWLFYPALLLIGTLMLIDATPQYTLLHGRLRDGVDPLLDVTGLWQGSWELFAPSPDHVNIRVGANIMRQNGKVETWKQPDWHSMSPLEQIRYFRQMSFFDNLVRQGNEPAQKAFCAWLARKYSGDGGAPVTSITLYEQRDVIPPPGERWRLAGSEPQFGPESPLQLWVSHDR